MSELKYVIGTNSWGTKAYETAIRGSYVDDAVIGKTVDTALEKGMTVLDTADDYGFGYAQKLIGKFRETKDFQISAKYTPVGRYKADQIHDAFAKQCRAMRTGYVDYYWLHLPNDVDQNLDEIIDLYKEGKIRNIGISNFNLAEAKHAKEYLEAHDVPLYGVQNHFSLLDRSEEENGMLAWCHENGIAFWGWAVLEEGILTGNTAGPFSRLYHRKRRKLEHLFEVMREIGDTHNLKMAQAAVVYCMSKGVIPVCGCRRPYQVEQLVEDAEVSFSEEEIRQLEAAAVQCGVKILKSDIFRFAVKKPEQNSSKKVIVAASVAIGIASAVFLLRKKRD